MAFIDFVTFPNAFELVQFILSCAAFALVRGASISTTTQSSVTPSKNAKVDSSNVLTASASEWQDQKAASSDWEKPWESKGWGEEDKWKKEEPEDKWQAKGWLKPWEKEKYEKDDDEEKKWKPEPWAKPWEEKKWEPKGWEEKKQWHDEKPEWKPVHFKPEVYVQEKKSNPWDKEEKDLYVIVKIKKPEREEKKWEEPKWKPKKEDWEW